MSEKHARFVITAPDNTKKEINNSVISFMISYDDRNLRHVEGAKFNFGFTVGEADYTSAIKSVLEEIFEFCKQYTNKKLIIEYYSSIKETYLTLAANILLQPEFNITVAQNGEFVNSINLYFSE